MGVFGLSRKDPIKVPKKNPYKRVARGDISRSLRMVKQNENRMIKRLTR